MDNTYYLAGALFSLTHTSLTLILLHGRSQNTVSSATVLLRHSLFYPDLHIISVPNAGPDVVYGYLTVMHLQT